MRVLEKGEGWHINVRCTGGGNGGAGCGSLLEVEKDDNYITSHTDYLGDTDYFYTVRCPVCGAQTDIASANLPQSIKEYSMDKCGGPVRILRIDYDR